jgi:hypothetical protein
VGFAWKSSCPCGMCASCGAYWYFTHDCSTYYGAGKFDVGPCSSCVLMDFTKALFTQFAPLSQGIITNMRATSTGLPCC